MKINNKYYTISSGINKSIVLISDLHYSNKKDIKNLNCVLDNIKKINPDYICIPGDFINKSYINDETVFFNWLKKLSKISIVIISIGNHEFYNDKKTFKLNYELLNKISNIDNIHLLNNENKIIDNINFIGFTSPIEYYDELHSPKEFGKQIDKLKISNKHYNVLLSHSPIFISSESVLKNRNIDLILCGHTHGGIVPNFLRKIFRNSGLISPNKRLFPKIAYGIIKIDNTNIIISSGIKVTHFNLINRILKPEVVNIRI